MKKINLILDCDTKNEIDDQFAITYALGCPDVKLLGVVTAQNVPMHGERSLAIYHRETQKILRLAKSAAPALRGLRLPLRKSASQESSAGVDFLVAAARKLGNKLTIAATGPATNIAAAFLQAPQIMKLPRIFWLGGFRSQSELAASKGAECNFDGDPLAARVLAQEAPNFILVPAWGVTDRMMMQIKIFSEELACCGSPLGRYLARLLDSTGQRHRIIWDPAGVAFARGVGAPRYTSRPAAHVIQRGLKRAALRTIDTFDEFEVLADFKKRTLGFCRTCA
jgi:inosine-uridine nucleoside N-ribohydrolase